MGLSAWLVVILLIALVGWVVYRIFNPRDNVRIDFSGKK